MTGLRVCAAVIVSCGRVLLIRRRVPEGDLVWQLPAGKVERGDSPQDAAVREAAEETGLAVAAVKVLGERVHPQTLRAIYAACELIEGYAHVADADELAEVRWVAHGELPGLVPAGLYAVVQEYLDSVLPGAIGVVSGIVRDRPDR